MHWFQKNFVIERSNIFAERRIKSMKEMRETCKIDKYPSIKFVQQTLSQQICLNKLKKLLYISNNKLW